MANFHIDAMHENLIGRGCERLIYSLERLQYED